MRCDETASLENAPDPRAVLLVAEDVVRGGSYDQHLSESGMTPQAAILSVSTFVDLIEETTPGGDET
jgi:hypothetical protein